MEWRRGRDPFRETPPGPRAELVNADASRGVALLSLIPNYRRVIVLFYLEVNKQQKAMTASGNFSSPPSHPGMSSCAMGAAGPGVRGGRAMRTTFNFSMKVVARSAQEKGGFSLSIPGYHSIPCATWQTRPIHQWEVTVFHR